MLRVLLLLTESMSIIRANYNEKCYEKCTDWKVKERECIEENNCYPSGQDNAEVTYACVNECSEISKPCVTECRRAKYWCWDHCGSVECFTQCFAAYIPTPPE